MPKVSLDERKFHWEKWKDESRAFWGRAILATPILLASVFFQYGFLTFSVPGVTLNPSGNPRLFYFLINLLSWYLLLFLGFKFVDLMRHRVPEAMEKNVHNNELPNPIRRHIGSPTLDLRAYGRMLYFIFPLYAVTLGILLAFAAWRTWLGGLLW